MIEKRGELIIHLFAYWHDPRWKNFVGATVKIRDLAHNLGKCGHEVVLFLPMYNFSSTNLPFKIVQIPLLDYPWVRRLSYNFSLLMVLIIISLSWPKPDAVYMRRMGSIIPALYARFRNSIFLFEVNDDPYGKVYQNGIKFIDRLRAYFSCLKDEINVKLSQRSFVITSEIKQKLAERIPILNPAKMIIAPSGANTRLFKPMPVQQCRANLKLNQSLKYIGFAGSLLNHSGLGVLVESAELINRDGLSCRFIIIGEGPMREIWQKAVIKRGMGNDFRFTGQVGYNKMPVWINSMDVCVAPYLKSAGLRSPVKIFDYLACSKPVIASRIEGTTEIFKKSGAVILIPPEDPEQLAGAIIDLLQNPKKSEEIGRSGRAFILKYYDRMNVAKQVMNVTVHQKNMR